MKTASPRPLRGIHWFKSIDEAILAEVAETATWTEYAEGEYLWRAGEKATSFVFIARGLVQVVKPSNRGEESTLGLFGPGEGVGNVASMGAATYPAAAIAASSPLVVVRVQGPAMLDIIRRHQSMMEASNRQLIEHTRTLRVKIDVLTAGSVSARLAVLLLHLAERFGDEGPDGLVSIPIPLSRGSLARLVGAREETVIRAMSVWRQEGWVSTDASGFTLHEIEPLKALLGDGDSPLSEG